MKKNKILIIVLTVVLVAACGTVAYLALSGKDDKPKATSEISQSETTTASTTASSTTQTTTETTTQTTTEASTKAEDKTAFITNGCWYLPDGDREVCYAFSFNKNGSADIAYFNSDNIEGFDAQYSEAEVKYEIKDNKIVISKFPSVMEIKKIELTIKDNGIEYKGEKLRRFDKINLSNALKCF